MLVCLSRNWATVTLVAATAVLASAESSQGQSEPKLVEVWARMAAARAAGDSAGWLEWGRRALAPDADDGSHPTSDLGVSELRAFSLADAAPAGTYVLDERPTLHGFNDIALAENGDVYVTDSPMDSVYRLIGPDGVWVRSDIRGFSCWAPAHSSAVLPDDAGAIRGRNQTSCPTAWVCWPLCSSERLLKPTASATRRSFSRSLRSRMLNGCIGHDG